MARILVIQHNLDDHLNELAAPLIEAGLEIDTWDVENAPAPTTPLSEYDGLISLGAIAGVLEEKDHAWMPIERKLFNQALDLEMPLLGICFGSQLLASAAGAEVYKTPTPEVGWTKVDMLPGHAGDPIMGALGKRPDVFHFHYDTFDMPEGAKLYGTTNGINQAFKVGPKAWGLQFHIEVGLAAMHSWFATYPKAFEKLGISVESQKELTQKNWKAYRERSIAVGTAFAKEVKKYHSVTK
ncbi:MAG: type 1 glutamine amidotransferase [Rhodoluna sp.]|nr:type 1 glutamine amidotransferase [Rhodoluna sp.]